MLRRPRSARRGVPVSTTRPCSSTAIRSAFMMVDSRCAITIEVRSASSRRRPCSIAASACTSTFAVASSSTRMRGSAMQRPRQRDQLALPGRQPAAALADLGLVAVRQPLDELVRAHRPGGGDHLELARARAAEHDVLAHGPGEQEPLLRHDAELARAGWPGVTSRRSCPSTRTRAALRVVEARDELRERRLPGAGLADQRERLARRRCAGHVLAAPRRLGAVVVRRRSS